MKDRIIPVLEGPMNPLRLDIPENLSVDSVEYYKQPECLHYEKCMNYAARYQWNQFHCRACGAFEPLPKEADIAVEEALRRYFANG